MGKVEKLKKVEKVEKVEISRIRYTIDDLKNIEVYQLPKFLFNDKFRYALSSNAKLLYSLLLDRYEFSLSNKWINENNEVFIIYKREEMCRMLCCSQPTIRKSINQLKDFKLIDEERQELWKLDIIYINNICEKNKIKGEQTFVNRDFKGFWIPKEIWFNEELTVQQKVFLTEIDSLDGKDGCIASNTYFSEFFNISKNRCSVILTSLVKKGYIKIKYIYRNGSKAIEKRIISINSEKGKDNNTLNNN